MYWLQSQTRVRKDVSEGGSENANNSGNDLTVSVKRRLRIADCRPGVKCRLSEKCRLQTESKMQAGCKMRNEDCRLFKHLCSFFSKAVK